MENNALLTLKQHEERVISDLQEFLYHKKKTSVTYGSRILEPFVVSSFEMNNNEKNILVKFEGHEIRQSHNHYWVDKNEFFEFVGGNRKMGAQLIIDNSYTDNGNIIFELRLSKNKLTNRLDDSVRLKELIIVHNKSLYKVIDLQVRPDKHDTIEDLVRILVTEVQSAENFIANCLVFKDNMEATRGPGMTIVLSGPNTQEEFVKKGDALKAIFMERKNTLSEINEWLQNFVNLNVDNADKIKEQFVKKFM